MTATENQAQFEMQDGKKKPPKLDDLAASQIGKKLRAKFDEVLSEPVPDRFVDLLNKLEAAEKKQSKDDADD
ncbi:NepR family anti-sigma factor [Oricola nitratireducens]|uniref:NepR family anti-sigma factor n=1 Tax=Oricola nitratireducens TaxID=2775868 RepID=UPI001FEEDA7C|nr:NepR family anti-sigma factor [Oricola nitratireducens]